VLQRPLPRREMSITPTFCAKPSRGVLLSCQFIHTFYDRAFLEVQGIRAVIRPRLKFKPLVCNGQISEGNSRPREHRGTPAVLKFHTTNRRSPKMKQRQAINRPERGSEI